MNFGYKVVLVFDARDNKKTRMFAHKSELKISKQAYFKDIQQRIQIVDMDKMRFDTEEDDRITCSMFTAREDFEEIRKEMMDGCVIESVKQQIKLEERIKVRLELIKQLSSKINTTVEVDIRIPH